MVVDIPVSFNKDGYANEELVFTNGRTITVIGAHLKSGEKMSEEGERVKILEKKLSVAASAASPAFVLMDSKLQVRISFFTHCIKCDSYKNLSLLCV